MRLTGTSAEADDLFQETWLRALSRPPSLDRDLGPWLDRVAKNLFIDRYRRGRRVQLSDTPELLPEHNDSQPATASPPLLRHEASRAWVIALSRLSPRLRAVFLLREMLELSTEQTAEALEMSTGAVRTSLHRARKIIHDASDATPTLPRDVLATLTQARVICVGDLAMMGIRTDRWQRLWSGPADSSVWRTLLELLVLSSNQDCLGSRAHLLYLAGAYAIQRHQFAKAQETIQEALHAAQELNDPTLLWLVQHERVYLGLLMGDSSLMDTGLEFLSQTSHTPDQSLMLNNVHANSFYRRGDSVTARELTERLLRRARTVGQKMYLEVNLALFETRREHLQASLVRVNTLLDEVSETGNPHLVINAWNTRGMVLQNLGRLKEAEASFHKAFELYQAQYGSGQCYTAMNNLALLRMEEGRLDEAWSLLCAASKGSPNQQPKSRAINLVNRGLVAMMAGRFPLALSALSESIAVAEDIENTHLLAHGCALQAAAHQLVGIDATEDWARVSALAHDNQTTIVTVLRAAGTALHAPEHARDVLDAVRNRSNLMCTERLVVMFLEMLVEESFAALSAEE